MSTTRTDNAGVPVEIEQAINHGWQDVSTSIVSTTTRKDNAGAAVDAVMVIHVPKKVLV